MGRSRCWGLHKWGKWKRKSYEIEDRRTGKRGMEYVQARTCERCNKTVERVIY